MTSSVATNQISTETAVKPVRIRLDYLDSLRGIAAIYVVLYHAYWFSIGKDIYHYGKPLRILFALVMYGHYAVDLFIVLSGYCLMLPVVRSASHEISHGLLGFIQRRAKRILPPYYAALLFSVCIGLLLNHLHLATNANESFTSRGLIAHVLLIHDFSANLSTQINPVMWSVAVEWQIYFVFAFLLFPVWKRLGSLVVVASALAITYPLTLIHNSLAPSIQSCYPWYIALFAMGMAAASVNFMDGTFYQSIRKQIGKPWFPIALLIVTICLAPFFRSQNDIFLDDVLIGVLSSTFIAYITNSIVSSDKRTTTVKVLEAKPLIFLGTFSYSIYLFHLPILDFLRAFLPPSEFHRNVEAVIIVPLQILAAIVLSYGFYVLVERQFQNIPKTHLR
jgi:peptidoglycan/LPS O-acetylase OafA/YrhL